VGQALTAARSPRSAPYSASTHGLVGREESVYSNAAPSRGTPLPEHASHASVGRACRAAERLVRVPGGTSPIGRSDQGHELPSTSSSHLPVQQALSWIPAHSGLATRSSRRLDEPTIRLGWGVDSRAGCSHHPRLAWRHVPPRRAGAPDGIAIRCVTSGRPILNMRMGPTTNTSLQARIFRDTLGGGGQD